MAVVALTAYVNSFGGQFVLDDSNVIIHNRRVHSLLPLGRFLESSQPVLEFSFALNYATGGLATTGYHVVNLLIHLLAGFVLFGIVRRTLESEGLRKRFGNASRPLAFMIAAIWLVHPLQTESVTYVVQRAEALMGLFYLLTLYAAIRAEPVADGPTRDHREAKGVAARPLFAGETKSGGSRVWIIIAIVVCALGMATKAVMVTAPLIVLLYDLLIRRVPLRQLLRRRWPLYVGLSTTWLVLLGLGVFQGVFLTKIPAATVGFSYQGVSALEYLRTQPEVILHYLRLCVWPVGQCLDYGWPVAAAGPRLIAAVSAIVVLIGLILWGGVRREAISVAGVWFFVVLFPTSSIIPIKDVAFEHRLYLPLAAVSALVVLFGYSLSQRIGLCMGAAPRAMGAARIATATVVLISLALLTNRRNGLYADPIALWRQTILVAPDNPRPHNALGYALFSAGRHDEAVREMQRAIELKPDYAGAFANVGEVRVAQGRFDDAARSFARAMELSPNEFRAPVHFYFGVALLKTGRPEEAIEQFQIAIGKDRSQVAAYYNLGNALRLVGRRESAAAVYRDGLAVNPSHLESCVNLGLTLRELGRLDEAIAAYRRGLRVENTDSDPASVLRLHYNLGLALLDAGRFREAETHLRRALQIRPDHAGVQAALERLPGYMSDPG